MKNIAVQRGLGSVIDHLREAGYKVFEFDTRQKNHSDFFDGFDAVVFTGLNDNVMGIQSTNINVPFIEARGMTHAEIENAIAGKVQEVRR
jgi:hypothetical protein